MNFEFKLIFLAPQIPPGDAAQTGGLCHRLGTLSLGNLSVFFIIKVFILIPVLLTYT